LTYSCYFPNTRVPTILSVVPYLYLYVYYAEQYYIYPQIHEPFDRVRVAGRAPSCPGGRVFPLHQRQFSVHTDYLSSRKPKYYKDPLPGMVAIVWVQNAAGRNHDGLDIYIYIKLYQMSTYHPSTYLPINRPMIYDNYVPEPYIIMRGAGNIRATSASEGRHFRRINFSRLFLRLPPPALNTTIIKWL